MEIFVSDKEDADHKLKQLREESKIMEERANLLQEVNPLKNFIEAESGKMDKVLNK